MRWTSIAVIPTLLLCLILSGCKQPSSTSSNTPPEPSQPVASLQPGEELFQANCAGCHQAGGNAMNPDKPVKGSNKLVTLDSFTAFLRHPSGSMPSFDEQQLPPEQTKALYEYIQKAFQ